MSKRRFSAVDLFCGVGGFSLGVEAAGFGIVLAVDSDPVNSRAYAVDFPDTAVLTADVRDLTGGEMLASIGATKGGLDLVIAGPPCQGFSVIGKKNATDARNELILEVARLVRELQPAYFVVENVPGILSARAACYRKRFMSAVAEGGYSVVLPIATLDASNYGVPQRRRRTFILGYRRGLPAPAYPSVLRSVGQPCVWDALADLACIEENLGALSADTYTGPLGQPSPYARKLRLRAPSRGTSLIRGGARELSGCAAACHTPEVAERFRRTVPGTTEAISRFPRLQKTGLSPTLRAGTGPSAGSFTAPRPIHPTLPRCITVREGARLQSFPDWFWFDPTKWHGFRQVGNAVPPSLARAVGAAIVTALESL
jgi:DNA (cytosine-5)-methyltransferase 1